MPLKPPSRAMTRMIRMIVPRLIVVSETRGAVAVVA
jgi:hypothetical protein